MNHFGIIEDFNPSIIFYTGEETSSEETFLRPYSVNVPINLGFSVGFPVEIEYQVLRDTRIWLIEGEENVIFQGLISSFLDDPTYITIEIWDAITGGNITTGDDIRRLEVSSTDNGETVVGSIHGLMERMKHQIIFSGLNIN